VHFVASPPTSIPRSGPTTRPRQARGSRPSELDQLLKLECLFRPDPANVAEIARYGGLRTREVRLAKPPPFLRLVAGGGSPPLRSAWRPIVGTLASGLDAQAAGPFL
jgi:hypothetical protein